MSRSATNGAGFGRVVTTTATTVRASIASTPLGKAAGIVRDYVLGLYYVVDDVPRTQRLWITPLLLGVEYLVYRVDALAERNVAVDLDVERNHDYDAFHAYKRAFERVLRSVGAWNDEVAGRVEDGECFIRLENGATSRGTVSRDEVIAMVELRPTDVRLLHAMIFALQGRPMDPAVRDLLWPVEVLADIANDLRHYDQDVGSGALNVYAAFVQLFGGSVAASELRREVDRYDAMAEERLARVAPDRREEIAEVCRRRYAAALATYPVPVDRSLIPAAPSERSRLRSASSVIAVCTALTGAVVVAVHARRSSTRPGE